MSYPLRIKVRPLLVSGHCGSSPTGIFINIAEGQSKEDAIQTVWHEILHVVISAGGGNHDESKIEEIAKRLSTACPEILELTGIQDKFT